MALLTKLSGYVLARLLEASVDKPDTPVTIQAGARAVKRAGDIIRSYEALVDEVRDRGERRAIHEWEIEMLYDNMSYEDRYVEFCGSAELRSLLHRHGIDTRKSYLFLDEEDQAIAQESYAAWFELAIAKRDSTVPNEFPVDISYGFVRAGTEEFQKRSSRVKSHYSARDSVAIYSAPQHFSSGKTVWVLEKIVSVNDIDDEQGEWGAYNKMVLPLRRGVPQYAHWSFLSHWSSVPKAGGYDDDIWLEMDEKVPYGDIPAPKVRGKRNAVKKHLEWCGVKTPG